MIYLLRVPLVSYATDLAMRHERGVPYVHLLTYLPPLLIVVFSAGLGTLPRQASPRVYAVLTGGRGLATS